MVTPRHRSEHAAGQTLRRTFAAGASLTALLLVVAIIAGAVSLMRLTEARETLLDGIGPAVRANQSLEDEGPRLPGLGERLVGLAVDHAAAAPTRGTATPIMQSRVTTSASSSSDLPSVPSGRIGSTM